ncbi:MAG: beta-ketoacyl-[acyl-carrier-protein] synthase family protein [Chthoniobacteraceae bacterium]
MKRVVVTGLGFTTSIGNSRAAVSQSLRECRTGVEVYQPFVDSDQPVKLVGTVKGFAFPTADALDWSLPDTLQLSRAELRTMTPNALYACAAMQEAIADAGLAPEHVSDNRTGFYCASAGSTFITHSGLETLVKRGVRRCSTPLVIAGMPNSLHLNLTARFKIHGASVGFSSACASSAHALGSAFDLIRLGRQKIMFVAGAEDCEPFNILPFAVLRALSEGTDPERSPCAFDAARDGFVVTGGGAVLVLEEADHAAARGATVYAEVRGWGQATDGYDVVAPDPAGNGLARAMRLALDDATLAPDRIDYLNAHATATLAGDFAEGNAIRQVFQPGKCPLISSTKSLTGHGLSLAGAMEAAFCCLAIREGFTPVSAHIRELDPAFHDLPIVTKPTAARPRVAMSNSSGFGGANVSVILSAP